MEAAIVVFPGSNCDDDCIHTYSGLLGWKTRKVWHKDTEIGNPDVVVLPGGFSYGDYLRAGAFGRISPIMASVKEYADKGGLVLGICNGFQILCECRLLPGALLKNVGMKFLSQFVHIKVENNTTPFTRSYSVGEVLTVPIAHGEGNYFADKDTVDRLEGEGRVVFRYCSRDGEVNHSDREINPNGSLNSIAGICNERGNVVGLMPHPERIVESVIGYIGGDKGLDFFRCMTA